MALFIFKKPPTPGLLGLSNAPQLDDLVSRYSPQATGGPSASVPNRPSFLGLTPNRVNTIADLLSGIGQSLMSQGPSATPQSPFQAVGQGIGLANQMGQQRQAQAGDDARLGIAQSQLGLSQQELADKEAGDARQQAFDEAQRAQIDEWTKGMPESDRIAARLHPEIFIKHKLETEEALQTPGTDAGKAAEDLKKGLIDKPTYDAIVRKQTYIPPQTPQTSYHTITGPTAKQLGLDPNGVYSIGSNGQVSMVSQPKQAAGVDTLSPAEIASLGLPVGTVAQRDASGRVNVVSQAPKPSSVQVLSADELKGLGLPAGTVAQRDASGRVSVIQKAPEQPQGAWSGTATAAQDSNIIAKGQADPAYRQTPEYSMAWSRQYEQPHLVTAPDPSDPSRTVQSYVMPMTPQGLKGPEGQAAAQSNGAGVQPVANSQAAAPPSRPSIIPITGTSMAKPATEDQAKNRQLYMETSKQLPIALAHFDALGDTVNQVAGSAGSAGNIFTGPAYQQAKNAVQTIIADYLYSVSGATANPGEVATRAGVLMPAVGDKAATIADKKARLQTMVDAIKVRASGGNAPDSPDDVFNVTGSGGSPAPANLYSKYGLTPPPGGQ